MYKKLAPFTRALYELQKKKLRPSKSVIVFIGHKAWNRGIKFSQAFPERTAILQPWLSPSDFYWPINQCNVVIVDTGYADISYVNALAACLYQAGAWKVTSIDTEFNPTYHHKE